MKVEEGIVIILLRFRRFEYWLRSCELSSNNLYKCAQRSKFVFGYIYMLMLSYSHAYVVTLHRSFLNSTQINTALDGLIPYVVMFSSRQKV